MDQQGKKKTLLSYLTRGVAMIHLDARRGGVVVPAKFAHDAHLRLNLSYRYAIPDFDITEDRVQATLSFGGVPFQCLVPWDAIFGITSHATGDGQVWPEDLPTEVVRSLADKDGEGARGAERIAPTPPIVRRPRPALVAVEGAQPRKPGGSAAVSSAPPAQEEPSQPDGEPPRRGHLRLVR